MKKLYSIQNAYRVLLKASGKCCTRKSLSNIDQIGSKQTNSQAISTSVISLESKHKIRASHTSSHAATTATSLRKYSSADTGSYVFFQSVLPLLDNCGSIGNIWQRFDGLNGIKNDEQPSDVKVNFFGKLSSCDVLFLFR